MNLSNQIQLFLSLISCVILGNSNVNCDDFTLDILNTSSTTVSLKLPIGHKNMQVYYAASVEIDRRCQENKSCVANSTTKPTNLEYITIENLCSGTHYFFEFLGQRVNASTFHSPPDKVILNVRGPTTTSAVVSWSKPHCPFGHNFSFNVTYWHTFENEALQKTVESVSETLITDLEPDSLYLFRLVTCTIRKPVLCTKTNQNASIRTLSLPLTTPSKPLNISAMALNHESISVSWNAPNITGPNLKYKVNCTMILGFGNYSNATDSLNRTHICHGLEPNSTYFVSVVATASNSSRVLVIGEQSDIVEVITKEETVTYPPRNLTVIPGESNLTIMWSPPNNTHPDKISHYNVYLNGSGSYSFITTTNLNMQFSHLKPYTYYTVSVSATDIDRLESANASTTARTYASRPSEPRNLTVNITNFTAILQWVEPLQKNGSLDGYRVTYFPITKKGDSAAVPVVQIISSENTTFIAENLAAWRNYSFSVQAFNYRFDLYNQTLFGPNATVKNQTAVGAPNQPLDVQPVFNNSTRSIHVTWKPPVPVTGPTSYEVTLETAEADLNTSCSHPYYLNWTSNVFASELNHWENDTAETEKWESGKCHRAFVKAITDAGTNTSRVSEVDSSNDLFQNYEMEILNLTVVEANTTLIVLSWGNPPSLNGKSIRYTIRQQRTDKQNNSTGQILDTNLDNQPIKYFTSGLEPGTSYTFTIQGCLRTKPSFCSKTVSINVSTTGRSTSQIIQKISDKYKLRFDMLFKQFKTELISDLANTSSMIRKYKQKVVKY